MKKKLYRSRKNKRVAGICGKISEWLSCDATIIRLIWAILSLFFGFGIVIYLIIWIIVPLEPVGNPYFDDCIDADYDIKE